MSSDAAARWLSMQSGGCQCGQVRYVLDGEYHRLNICHCRDCQRQSGSAFGMSLVIPAETFTLTAGELRTFELEASSGRIKTCAFCPGCGVRIFNRTSVLYSVKAGTLDDVSWLQPDAHYWIRRRQTWMALAHDLPCYEEHE
jgi:hypothetical protein